MSNINPEEDYASAAHTLPFVINQQLKLINTAMPGIVNAYDAAKRTVQVTPAIKRTFTDGRQPVSYPVLEDVPVLFPAFGIYRIEAPLEAGDAVLLIFSQRGLADFKASRTSSLPSDGGFFSLSDAIALPGFVGLNVPADLNGALVVSTEDGNYRVALSASMLELQASNSSIRLKGPSHVDRNDPDDGDIVLSGRRIVVRTDGGGNWVRRDL